MIRSLICLTTALSLSIGLGPWGAGAAWAETAEAEKPSPVVEAPRDSGAYLAARNAEANGDFRAAAAWFGQAHLGDPENPQVIDGAIFANMALGNITVAAELAKQRLEAKGEDAPDKQLADYAIIAEQALRDDYEGLLQSFKAGRSIGPMVDALAVAWADIGLGQMTEALAEFDKISKTKGLEAYGLYHKALALALAGDFEGADKILSGKSGGRIGLNRRGVMAHAQILSQLERNKDAIALLDNVFGASGEPGAEALRARLEAGEPVPFDTIRGPRDGLAETFFSLASLLSGEADPAYTLLNTRIAVALQPDHQDAVLLGASMLEELGEYDLAEEAYASFPPEDPAYYQAQMGRANALYEAGRKEPAIEVLQELSKSHGDLLVVQTALGDLYRREQNWPEAEAAYDAALALLPENPQPNFWPIYFSRAIAKERQGKYDAADLDFRAALKLNPDRPEVLNYLGYSLIERRKNLDEAFAMIKRAHRAEPESGYIVDSLAWGYFTLGKYTEALAPMEKASLLEPVDPVVTDHLGDVYWMNGRKREARFQWQRALSFGPEEKEAIRIRRKLEIGLDAVLAEEASGKPAPAGDEAVIGQGDTDPAEAETQEN